MYCGAAYLHNEHDVHLLLHASGLIREGFPLLSLAHRPDNDNGTVRHNHVGNRVDNDRAEEECD